MSNSSTKAVAPLFLEAASSRRVRFVSLTGLLLTVLAVAALPLPLPALLLGVLLLIAMFVYSWRHHHALNGAVVKVRLDTDGNWHWQQGELSERVELLGDSYHVVSFVILNFRQTGKRGSGRSLLLTADNIDPDTFRRLRMHLNWQEGRREKSKEPLQRSR